MTYALRFPKQLQRSRLRRGWKQTRLAEEVGVKPRTLISWETGERVPPVGFVVRLSALLEADLLSSYITDDMTRRYGQVAEKHIPLSEYSDVLHQYTTHGDETTHVQAEKDGGAIRDVATEHEQQSEEIDISLDDLFQILAMLQKQPSLIPVTLDFLQTLTLN